MPQNDLKVLKFFFNKDKPIELSPRDLDEQMEFGLEKSIDIFLDLEVSGLLKWSKLNLMELELGRSTKEIYEEVYNSSAHLTKEGKLLITNNQSSNQEAS